MRKLSLLFVMLSIVMVSNCDQGEALDAEARWRLGWWMIASAMEEDYATAELRFDSLRAATTQLDRPFLISGLETKLALGKTEEAAALLAEQDVAMLTRICLKPALKDFPVCENYAEERVENEELRRELLRMYVRDQAARANVMTDVIAKYQLDTTGLSQIGSMGQVDEQNRTRLKEIFAETGFPTREQVGYDAMQGVFMMIQHSDRDPAWQQAQFPRIEQAVKRGDLDGQSYAYLYDRIKVNAGEPQLYGTQFAKVDPVNKIVELQPVEDIEQLDERRRALGMMPIEMYKEFVFSAL